MAHGTLQVDGRELERRVRWALAQGLNTWLDNVLTLSSPLVPLDEGPLQESGHVVEAAPDNLTGQVRYSKVYAARQHEELTWRHAPGRQAKYLEQPYKQQIPGLAHHLRGIVQNVIRVSGGGPFRAAGRRVR